jgi:LPS O-antigen subunit length determinant protein (WzzB/FepE family)
MQNSVIIVIVLALLCAWIAWLVYNYKVITHDIAINDKIKYYANRYNNLQDCLNDVIAAIHQKFPESTIQYVHNNEGIERVEGEIKY